MRILLSPRFWMSIGIMCLSVASATGCRSGMGAGPGWFSWMNPKPPSAGALATTPPTKPSSVAMLPNPTTTTGATTPGTGTGAAIPYAGAAQQHAAHNPAPNHYNTGPYPMSGHGSSPSLGAAAGASASNPYAGSSTSAAPSAPGYNGYQSPYANSLNNAARTADNRSSYQAPDANTYRSNPYANANPQGVAPAGNTSSDQWNRGASLGNSGSAPATFNESAPRGFAESQAEQPMGTAGGWTPPANNASSQSNYLDKYQPTSAPANPAAAAQTPRRNASGPYQPGSTSRNGGTLPATLNTGAQPSSAVPATSSYPSTNFPATSYPAGNYPASNYPTSSYQSTGYPASNYPTMDPARTATGNAGGINAYQTAPGTMIR
jgi:hypothetical protein